MKKTFRRASVYILMGGACLYLGLLSLGGMYALIPSVSIAIASLVLSVAYEGEIYKQNLSNAMNKLTQPKSLTRRVTRAYLKQLFDTYPEMVQPDPTKPPYPQFFKDYICLLKKAHHSKIDKKKLKDMEDWFSEIVFEPEKAITNGTSYQRNLVDWLNNQKDNKLQPKSWLAFHARQKNLERYAALPLSLLAGLFSALGTTFLLFETITIVPALAVISLNVWLVLVIPIALIAGAAYGFLTYNCSTDFLLNNPFTKWGNKIKGIWTKGRKLEAVAVGIAFSALCLLAAGLTICTAGTWCTIVNENRSIYAIITALPKWVMGLINPIVTSLSSIIFNLQNTSASFSMLKQIFSHISKAYQDLKKDTQSTWNKESWLQFINPFRFVYTVLFFPLRLTLFMGHLISIGVTSDRVPGISKKLSAGLGAFCEGGEDSHYFFGHGCGEGGHSLDTLLEEHLEGDGHNHDLDLPTMVLSGFLWPLNFLSRQWATIANAFIATKSPEPESHTHCCHHHDTPHAPPVENNWTQQHPIWFIENYRKKHDSLSKESVTALKSLSQQINNPSIVDCSSQEKWNKSVITTLSNNQKELPSEFVHKFKTRFG